jgi:hypothetical protein
MINRISGAAFVIGVAASLFPAAPVFAVTPIAGTFGSPNAVSFAPGDKCALPITDFGRPKPAHPSALRRRSALLLLRREIRKNQAQARLLVRMMEGKTRAQPLPRQQTLERSMLSPTPNTAPGRFERRAGLWLCRFHRRTDRPWNKRCDRHIHLDPRRGLRKRRRRWL